LAIEIRIFALLNLFITKAGTARRLLYFQLISGL
jgi:hypothetical protein